jgi:hypothetical protein
MIGVGVGAAVLVAVIVDVSAVTAAVASWDDDSFVHLWDSLLLTAFANVDLPDPDKPVNQRMEERCLFRL